MRKPLIATTVCLVAGVLFTTASEAQYRPAKRYNEPSFRIQLGEFEPDGNSSYWDDSAFDFDRDASDFEDATLGLSYIRPLGPKLALQISGFFYEAAEDLAYRRFEDQAGNDILHTTEVELAAVTAGLIYKFTGPDAALVPYVGAGGGLYAWSLTEFGDFIDFDDPDLEIFDAFFEDEDEELGVYFTAGLEVPLADTWALFAEARWDSAEADLAGDFQGLGEMDLSGRSYSAGISWSF
ncbi:MAG: outer membrane beta-barrel protein [bacterium]|nr:outer membrane beta-barrel protein [bacterium]